MPEFTAANFVGHADICVDVASRLVTLIRQPVTSRAQTTEGIEDEDLP
jgi:hypothetical protein